MKKRILSIILCLCMTMTLLPAVSIPASAADIVSFIDENGNPQSAAATQVTSDMFTWTDGWYYVSGSSGSVSIPNTITVSGNVFLILEDGCSLAITGSTDSAGICVGNGNTLTIYGQSEGSGTLTATGNGNGAGIGCEGYGSIIINGGTIYATGNGYGAGIGGNGGLTYCYEINVTINNGTVCATSNGNGAGIGGGYHHYVGSITINGGTVVANSYGDGAGIGSGKNGNCTNATINGGTVVANGNGNGAGIGSGNNSSTTNITINGGIVTAKGYTYGTGIGGCYYAPCGSVTITGGIITATSNDYGGAGIGGSYYGNCASVTITGGTITATGAENGAGIGGGLSNSSGTVYISGGSVKASGGTNAQDIGNGYLGTGITVQNNSSDKSPVYLTAVTLEGLTAKAAVTTLSTLSYTYGRTDMYTDDIGKLYLYLPENTETTAATAEGINYAGLISTAADSVAGTLYVVPAVSSVSVPAAGISKAGDSLDFTVNFSTNVTVDTSFGTPYIPLTIDGATVHADYQSGSGTAGLIFRYTVHSGDNDSDGMTVGSSILLNGGTIKNGDADALLILNNIPDTSSVLIDAAAPTASAVTPAASAANVSVDGNIQITFSEAMYTSAGAVSLTPSGGSAVSLIGGTWSDGSTTYTVSYTGLAYDKIYTLSISDFKDVVGNIMSVYSHSFTTEPEPLTPSVSSESLTIDKGGTGSFSVALGQGTAAADSATITVTDGAIASVDSLSLTENGTVTVTGLAAGTTDVTVAFNDTADTLKTVAVTVVPVTPAWPADSSLTASGVTQTGAVLSWTEANDVTAVTAYQIYQDSVLIGATDGSTLTYSVAGLSASTDYSFQAQAGNADGLWTTDGPTVSVTTSAASSGSRSITATVTGVDGTSGTINVATSGSSASAAMSAALGDILAGGGTLELTIPTVKNMTGYGVALPAKDLCENTGGTLTMHTDLGSIAVPSDMLSSLSGITDETAEITISRGNTDVLPKDVRAAIGDRPLVQLTLSIDGTLTGWNNADAPVTVCIPYTPTAEELASPESIVIWYIDGSGNIVTIPSGHYDQATGTATFSTTHFSLYAIGYNNIAFSDVPENAWYNGVVSFIAARGITGGTSDTTFSPDDLLTRGQFITLLMRAYGIAPDESPTDNFSDAGSTYYTGYLAAAKQLGIADGVGNNEFAPEQPISRQQMFTLLYNALKEIDRLPGGDSGKTLTDFTDGGSTASYAREALDYLVKAGVVNGNDGYLLPAATTTRAQMAQVFNNLLVNE